MRKKGSKNIDNKVRKFKKVIRDINENSNSFPIAVEDFEALNEFVKANSISIGDKAVANGIVGVSQPLKNKKKIVETAIDAFNKAAEKEMPEILLSRPLPQPPKTAVYTLELKVNDRTYQSTGETLEEAINNIKIEPTHGVIKIYTKGILKVKKGEREIERLLFIRQMSRLFGQASKLGKECAMVQATRLINALLADNR